MSFAVGSLVRARGREWVVLPDSTDHLIRVRPLGGLEDEATGILTSLEQVTSATFALPSAADLGDFRSSRLLRDAVRIGFRSSAGPFRCFGRLGVEPRPYQLVPLLMALKLDPIRLLIADDVGIGKTIEACLIARELIDRGEATRLAVLCPPHLAEQWQEELLTKFNIDAELVLPSTAARLERSCATGQSLFDVFPFVVVSMDYIKSESRRAEFVRSCGELIIVDEAHTCAFGSSSKGGRHQRYQLLKDLAHNEERHIILVTATPHSGNEEAFRSLLGLLRADFDDFPEDLSGDQNIEHRRILARHFVQRRRGDIKSYLGSETLFPQRVEKEESYKLSPEYKLFFEKVIAFIRQSVQDKEGGAHRQRVRWWSALALLRAMASSPAAAMVTLQNRSPTVSTASIEEADELGTRCVIDGDNADEQTDVTPGSIFSDDTNVDTDDKSLLDKLAADASALKGRKDNKLLGLIAILEQLLKDKSSPIVFCRFIDTANYLAEELRKVLPKDVNVMAVTGMLPPLDREQRVQELALSQKRILVCTDCLSEGINLQKDFDTVVHYDLSWNPTRHEQREGRVDRFGQPNNQVKVITYFGIDNQIDGIILDVLIRKHKTIRGSLGISVPVPSDTNQVVEAVFEGLLLRTQPSTKPDADTIQLKLFSESFEPQKKTFFAQWELAADRERKSHQSMFAQQTIKVEDVSRELSEARDAIGSGVDIRNFVIDAFKAHRAVITSDDAVHFDLRHIPKALAEALPIASSFEARFDAPIEHNQLLLTRTHPIVEAIATHIINSSLDALLDGVAKRAGVTRTRLVQTRTTLLTVRGRYHIVTKRISGENRVLAEDCVLVAFSGAPESPNWLTDEQAQELLGAEAHGNIAADLASEFIQEVIDHYSNLQPELEAIVSQRADALLEAHRRVRIASKNRGVRYEVIPQMPVDVLGIYVFLPMV